MRPPICTIDASCVIALGHLDLLPQLSFLFSRVLVPKAVRTELFRRRATKDRLRAILASYSFIERCDDYDKGTVDILLIERAAQGGEDRGEAEAVVQAAAVGAVVIVDDPWGRALAERFGRDLHGTFWILVRACQRVPRPNWRAGPFRCRWRRIHALKIVAAEAHRAVSSVQ